MSGASNGNGKIKFKGTKAEERVVIAKDIIAALRARRFAAEFNTYVDEKSLKRTRATKKNSDAQTLLVAAEIANRPCRVCARGAVVVAMVRRHDRLEVPIGVPVQEYLDDIASGWAESDYVEQLFATSQFRNMEYAFDGGGSDSDPEWADAYPDPDDRLDAIMRNVVENDGAFLISKIPKPRKPSRRSTSKSSNPRDIATLGGDLSL